MKAKTSDVILPFLIFISLLSYSAKADVFHMALRKDPISLDFHKRSFYGTNILYHNVYSKLYTYDSEGNLHPLAAKECKSDDAQTTWTCELNKDVAWSDGKPQTAKDYIDSFNSLNLNKIKRSDILNNILRIQASGKSKLTFKLRAPDHEFLHKLAAGPFFAFRNQPGTHFTSFKDLKFSGPFVISDYLPGKHITLSPNPHFKLYPVKHRVKLHFVHSTHTSMLLYDKGQLDFIRTVPTLLIPKFQNTQDFKQFAMYRLDHIGFGPQMKSRPLLRKALTHSLNYQELEKLYFSRGLPGCIGIELPQSYNVPCYSFDLNKAKQAYKLHLEEEEPLNYIELLYPSTTSGDFERGMQWLQSQWRNNLGLEIRARGLSSGLYFRRLKVRPPALFRQSVALGSGGCKATLEPFSKSSFFNVSKWSDTKIESAIDEADCKTGFKLLMNSYFFIPTGKIHFSTLLKPAWTGLSWNPYGQMDFSKLKQLRKSDQD
jgi:oligopeptide transport system substrate-binding protein